MDGKAKHLSITTNGNANHYEQANHIMRKIKLPQSDIEQGVGSLHPLMKWRSPIVRTLHGYAILDCEEFSCLKIQMDRDTISWIPRSLNTGGTYMERRKLKVYYGRGKGYQRLPQIVLQGLWLERMGFSVGDRLTVNCNN